MFYLFAVAMATLIISLINFFADGIYSVRALGGSLLLTLAGVAAVFVIDALFAFVIRRLPEKWFLPEARAFAVSKKERAFYRKTKINEWKKYVPEWGCFTGFHKDKLREPSDSEYLGRFLIESNYGVAGHIAGAIFGFAIMLIPPLRPLTVALPIATVNFILSVLPTMILRFNTPALRGLYRRNLEREKRKPQRSDEIEKEVVN